MPQGLKDMLAVAGLVAWFASILLVYTVTGGNVLVAIVYAVTCGGVFGALYGPVNT